VGWGGCWGGGVLVGAWVGGCGGGGGGGGGVKEGRDVRKMREWSETGEIMADKGEVRDERFGS